MVMNALSAVNAYRNQLKLQDELGDAAQTEETSRPSFSNMLKNSMEDAVSTLHQTEAMKMDALTGGKVDLSDLVTAVNNAELTLNTVVAVRDKVINAYQDIIRMPM